jgi:hypothetical protein
VSQQANESGTSGERNPDTLPNKGDPSGKCPRCGRVSNFAVIWSEVLRTGAIGRTSGAVEWATVLECHGCHEKSVVVDVVDSFEGSGGFTLFDRIEQMVQEKTLWNDFGDWAHHVRDTGNAGAHGEKFDPVTMEQATDLQKFIRELINFLYEQPARLAAAMPATKKANTAASGGTTPAGATGTPPGSGQA